MFPLTLFYFAVLGNGNFVSAISSGAGFSPRRLQPKQVCEQIATSTSNASTVYDFLLGNYEQDISHWVSSSTQFAACTFEPGTAEDVGIALRFIGDSQTPFAVKGGGHSSNPGFSSTLGVQITMTKFSEVSYDSAAQTVTIGAGLIWDEVYAALEPHGVNGRVTGVGVAGFILGGGYSWLTNQYGLTVDTVQAFEVVLSNGTVVDVTGTTNPDLFFALKGGLNNFGGLITYTEDVLGKVNLATANFAANNRDPKAAIITTYNSVVGLPGVSEIIFYDGPSPPAGMFDEFLAIPFFTKDISTRSFLSLVLSSPSNDTSGTRGIFNTISVANYSLSLIESIVNETIHWGEHLLLDSGFFISYDVEPFLPNLFSHNTTPSAYPPSRTEGLFPLNIYYGWLFPISDQVFHDAIRTSAETLKAQAVAEGQSDVDIVPVYPNYAIFDTPLSSLYGTNLPRLQAIKTAMDPDNIMGLAGGFKL